jgi:hypothetical protein
MRAIPVVLGVFLIVISFGLGCVDVDKQLIGPVDYRSEARFVNLAVPFGSVTLRVDDTQFGTAAVAATLPASGYTSVPSGRRIIYASYSAASDTVPLPIPTEWKGSVLIYAPDAATREYLWVGERYTFETPTIADNEVQIRVVNVCPDGGTLAVSATVTAAGVDTVLVSELPVTAATPYAALPSIAGGFPYVFYAYSATDTLVRALNLSSQLSAKKRYTAVIYDVQASVKTVLLTDD